MRWRTQVGVHRLAFTGTTCHVAFASSAERLVVAVRTGDGDTDIDLLLVDPNADGVTLEQKLTVASDAPPRAPGR